MRRSKRGCPSRRPHRLRSSKRRPPVLRPPPRRRYGRSWRAAEGAGQGLHPEPVQSACVLLGIEPARARTDVETGRADRADQGHATPRVSRQARRDRRATPGCVRRASTATRRSMRRSARITRPSSSIRSRIARTTTTNARRSSTMRLRGNVSSTRRSFPTRHAGGKNRQGQGLDQQDAVAQRAAEHAAGADGQCERRRRSAGGVLPQTDL
ncbi:Uncharacterised protein [Burkholderia cenocepacia]|nr:Uncharacterised protein [Burkholderia cenocepacia]